MIPNNELHGNPCLYGSYFPKEREKERRERAFSLGKETPRVSMLCCVQVCLKKLKREKEDFLVWFPGCVAGT